MKKPQSAKQQLRATTPSNKHQMSTSSQHMTLFSAVLLPKPVKKKKYLLRTDGLSSAKTAGSQNKNSLNQGAESKLSRVSSSKTRSQTLFTQSKSSAHEMPKTLIPKAILKSTLAEIEREVGKL